MNDRIAESLAFRYGRILPNLIPSVLRLREKENLEIKDRNVPLPHIKNAIVTRVPSEDIATQKILQDQMQQALDDMHMQLIDDVSRFIDNRVKDIDWLTAPVTIDYLASDREFITKAQFEVLSADQESVDALLKLLSFFAVLGDTAEVSKPLFEKAKKWFMQSQPLLTELQMIRGAGKIDPSRYPLVLNNAAQEQLFQNLKAFRKDMWKPNRKKAMSTNVSENSKYGLLNNLLSFFNSEGTSSNQFNLISKNVSLLKDHDLNKMFIPTFEGDAAEESNKLQHAIKKLGGKGHFLTVEEAKKLRNDDPDKYKEYLTQNGKVRNAIRIKIREAIRQSGTPLMMAAKVKQLLEEAGLPTYYIPKGFETGYYDENMNMYNPKGVQFRTPQIGGWIKFNPSFNLEEKGNQFIAKGQGLYVAQPSYIHSVGQTAVRNAKVNEAVEHNMANLGDIRNKWREDQTSSDEKDRLKAFMVEAIYQLGQRIGNENQQTINRETGKAERTYGIGTLQAKHFKRKGAGYVITFPAKSGVIQSTELQPDTVVKKRLVNFIHRKLEGKRPTDYVWTHGANDSRMHESSVNGYLKSIGWMAGSHKMRHVKGSIELKKELRDNPPPKNPTQKTMDAYVKNILFKVGELLGHKRTVTNANGQKEQVTTHATASSYVDPNIIANLYKERKLRVPNYLAKKTA